MKKYSRRSAKQWQALIDDQKASGLSAPQFCNERDIGYPSFCAWRKRLNSSDSAPPLSTTPTFVELTSADPVEQPGTWTVELELGTGMCLRIAKA